MNWDSGMNGDLCVRIWARVMCVLGLWRRTGGRPQCILNEASHSVWGMTFVSAGRYPQPIIPSVAKKTSITTILSPTYRRNLMSKKPLLSLLAIHLGTANELFNIILSRTNVYIFDLVHTILKGANTIYYFPRLMCVPSLSLSDLSNSISDSSALSLC